MGLTLPALALARWRALTRLEARTPVPEREYALLPGLSLFAPLPVARLEDVARHAETVHAAAGEHIIREGDHGDRFYVISSGAVQVTERGSFRVAQRRGALT